MSFSDAVTPSAGFGDLPTLQSLNYGEHFCLWSIRTTVACTSVCRAMLREFHTAFDDAEVEAHAAFRAFLHSFGKGHRPIRIGRPGHIGLTPDEVCLVELLRAAHFEDRSQFEAYACWILAGTDCNDLYTTAETFTRMLRERGHRFRAPRPCPRPTAGDEGTQWKAIARCR